MQLEPSLVYVAGIAWVVLMAGMMLNRVGQPIVIAYLLAGILLGPSVFGLIADAHLLTPLGGMGLVLLMFFVGMGVHPTELQRTWRVGVAAVLLQITVTVACVGSIGWLLDWPIERTLLLSFAMCNSSTPVVMRMLSHKGLADGAFGSGVISVLLVQDIAIVPMLMLLSLFVGSSPGYFTLAQQLFGAIIAGVEAGGVMQAQLPAHPPATGTPFILAHPNHTLSGKASRRCSKNDRGRAGVPRSRISRLHTR